MKHLIIGGGSIGKRHIRNLNFLNAGSVYCLRRKIDPIFDEEFDCKSILREEINNFDFFDSIFICTPTQLHFENLKDVAEHSSKLIAVFMEKPFLLNDKDFRYLLTKPNIKIFMGFMLRFHPSIIKIKQTIDERILGKIYYCRFEFGSYLPDWHPNEDYKKSYAARREMGGGVINTICHELDLLTHFFGFPLKSQSLKTSTDILQINCEDIADLSFKYPWGLSTIHLNYLDKTYHRKIEIKGTEGKIEWNWNENKVQLTNGHKQIATLQETIKFDTNQLYLDELIFFLDSIRHGHKEDFHDLKHIYNFAQLLEGLSSTLNDE